jgi:putative tricarboxylic transport membrane protein
MNYTQTRGLSCVAAIVAAGFVVAGPAAAEWKPTKTVEFIVPAGTGGGADQMARTLQGVIQKHELMDQSLVVLNKSGGAGGEGFLDIKGSNGNPHKIIITLSNLFTTPMSTGIPFTWQDITPVSMLALDEFVLWVNSDSEYKTAAEYVTALKASKPNDFKMAGTGTKQEDQIITAALEQVTGAKFTYVPYKGGGDAARRQARRFDGEQPDRGRCAVARGQGSSAVRVRLRAHEVSGEGDDGHVLGGHPDL